MTEVAVWSLSGKARSQSIATALGAGASTIGYKALIRMDSAYRGPVGDIAAFYGFQKCFPKMMADYRALNKTVIFVDLGYWGRRHGGKINGFHKVSVNARHPNAYLMAKARASKRLEQSKVRVLPWKTGGKSIIVAGMSDKSAESYGLKPTEWESWAIAELKKHTKRPIIYRPKPSWRAARPIAGAEFQKPTSGDADASTFVDCHAVVTHHSNMAMDALINGVPAFCWDGAPTCMSLQDLAQIETPLRPDNREQWLANLAWCQFSVAEIQSGMMWRTMKNDGFIP